MKRCKAKSLGTVRNNSQVMGCALKDVYCEKGFAFAEVSPSALSVEPFASLL